MAQFFAFYMSINLKCLDLLSKVALQFLTVTKNINLKTIFIRLVASLLKM